MHAQANQQVPERQALPERNPEDQEDQPGPASDARRNQAVNFRKGFIIGAIISAGIWILIYAAPQ